MKKFAAFLMILAVSVFTVGCGGKTDKTPAEKTPAEKTPAEKTPAEKTPAEKTPVDPA
jgi:PBP1b-binding outer membrane lipoprotein LpoB